MRSNPAQLSFSAGEVSPLLYGRIDYQRAQTGLRRCRGFLPLRQGAVTRAPGTLFRGTTRENLPARLIGFQFAEDDAVVLEFTDLRMRVWRYGNLVMSGASPYELATPYEAAALPRLKWAQSADVIYLVDGVHRPRRLARHALDDWTIEPAAFERGPFRVENGDSGITIKASAATGSVTLTGAGGPFVAGHVGSLFQLRAIDDEDIPTWVGNAAVEPGDYARYDGRIYVCMSGDNTGVNPPIHTEGKVRVGPDGPVWSYISDQIGIVRITAVANANSASAVVVKRIPPAIVAAPTYRWSEGAWSTKNGQPSAIAIHDQRLVLAGTPADPRTLWFSAVGDYLGFEPGTLDDESFAYAIAGVASQNRILWLQSGARGLHVGALGEEYSSRSTTAAQAIGAGNARFLPDSTIGSWNAQPVAPDGKPVFITRDGRRLFELRYAFEADANVPVELSLPSEHLGSGGFREIVWQGSPLRLGWVRCASGGLAIVVNDAGEDVLGWATLPVAGGAVESVVISAGPGGGTDDVLTLVVRREIGGDTVRYVEVLAIAYGIVSGAQPASEAVHLYAAQIAVGDPAFDLVEGLGHLDGEEVFAWTDRGELGPLTVSDGAVHLPVKVNRAVVGLFDPTHVIESMDLAGVAQSGGTLGLQKRAKAVGIRWHRTAAAEMRMVEREFAKPEVAGKWVNVTSPTAPYDIVDVHSGVLRADLPSGYAKEVTYQVRPVGGAPLTLLAAVPIVDVAEG